MIYTALLPLELFGDTLRLEPLLPGTRDTLHGLGTSGLISLSLCRPTPAVLHLSLMGRRTEASSSDSNKIAKKQLRSEKTCELRENTLGLPTESLLLIT